MVFVTLVLHAATAPVPAPVKQQQQLLRQQRQQQQLLPLLLGPMQLARSINAKQELCCHVPYLSKLGHNRRRVLVIR